MLSIRDPPEIPPRNSAFVGNRQNFVAINYDVWFSSFLDSAPVNNLAAEVLVCHLRWNVALSFACIWQIKSICYHNNFYILSKGDMWEWNIYLHTKCFLFWVHTSANVAKVWPYFSSRWSAIPCVCACGMHVVRQNENVAREVRKQHVLKIFMKTKAKKKEKHCW